MNEPLDPLVAECARRAMQTGNLVVGNRGPAGEDIAEYPLDAAEQAETGNEARARLLSPTIDRLAREAAEAPEHEPTPFEPWWTAFRLPWWLAIQILVCAGWVAAELYWMVKRTP